MFINLRLTFIISICFFTMLCSSSLYSEESAQANDTPSIGEINSPLRFGIVYSPIQAYQFVTDAGKKHICGSGFNLGYLLDYYVTPNFFASFNFGALYYTDFMHNHYLRIDSKISHLYYGDLSYSFSYKIFHAGVGVGISYLDFYREFETFEDDVDYEYYLYNTINSSLDLTLRLGFEINGTYNIDFRYSYAMANLRDMKTDLKSKSILGITFALKFPSYKNSDNSLK